MADPDSHSGPPPSLDPERMANFVQELTAHQRMLAQFVRALLVRSADADDVLQETNLVLWKKAAEFTPGTDFGRWARQVAKFQVLAFWKRTRTAAVLPPEIIESLSRAAEDRAESQPLRREALHDCLNRLPPDQRSLVERRYAPEASVSRMADELGKSAKAVSEQLRRIRLSLLQCIQQRLRLEGTS